MKMSDHKVDLAHLTALLKDTVRWMPSLRPSLEKDLVLLQSLVESRGWPIIMIDLPKAGKVLDLSLSNLRIDPSTLPKTFGRVNGQSRKLFSGLFQMIFDESCNVRPINDDIIRAVFFLRCILYLYKKVVRACSQEHVMDAILEFVSIEQKMRRPSLEWLSYSIDPNRIGGDLHFLDGHRSSPDLVDHRSPCTGKLLALMQTVCDRFFGSFPEIDYRELQPRHGKGAVADAKTGTDKYQLPNWPDKLNRVFPVSWFGWSREDLHLEVEVPWISRQEFPARLIPVPKTLDKPRIIASEPTSHQYCQQAVLAWLRENMPATAKPYIHFTDQRPSQELALGASRGIDGLSTVDLSSASDRLSCWVIERALRRNSALLDALHACRTRWLRYSLPIGLANTQWLILRKYAPQGNATTFPIQAMVYLCCVLTAVLFEDGKKPTTRNILSYVGQLQVFGDDIVIPSRAVRSLTLLMDHLGLKVNMSKTHVGGLFRESCGMDAFCGEDVTPCYLRHTEFGRAAEVLQSFVDVSNNAYKKGLWELADLLALSIPYKMRKLLLITKHPGCSLSLTTFQESTDDAPNKRWNNSLHYWEVPALQVQSKTVKGERTDHQNLLQYFTEDPDPETNWKAGFLMRTSSIIKKTWVQVPPRKQ